MSTLDEIARRLEAVEGIDWSETAEEHAAEYYGDWLKVGPAWVLTDLTPSSPVDVADAAEGRAVAEFLQHAVADMRALLDAARATSSGSAESGRE
ncbi:hypothetical protein [Acrocarpospora sp. B8E8]|uniref:hypothetical protein n=1 Tax=Acrocarpospora sp. B8E8 TaxID=3153572 RepID=UPI00325D2F7F